MSKVQTVITCGDEVKINLSPNSYLGVIREVNKLPDTPYKEALMDESGRKILRPETLGEIGDIYIRIQVLNNLNPSIEDEFNKLSELSE